MRAFWPKPAHVGRYVEDDIDYERPGLITVEASNDPNSNDMSRMREINRVFSIARLLCQGEYSMEQIATECGISTRTVRRYIYALQLAGFDIYQFRSVGRFTTLLYRMDRRSWHGFMHLPKD